jgi:3-phosphoshikimate 1-carboxyvinyltransferase
VVDIRIPGSKSITARALFLAAAADGETRLVQPLRSDDTEAFAEGLRQLGYGVDDSRDDEWVIGGRAGGPPRAEAEVFCRDGATAARFLPALAATGRGSYRFDASEQMRRRPMAPLTNALTSLGVKIDFGGAPDHHPLALTADGIEGGSLTLDASISSQFLTALLLLAPLTRAGLRIDVSDLVSVPYVGITVAMMRSFGAEVDVDGSTYRVRSQAYRPQAYRIEPDASSASYFFAAAALVGGEVTAPGLGSGALQGDLAFAEVLEEMGAHVRITPEGTTVRRGTLRGGTYNMRDISDTMPTLAAIAPFAEAPTRIVDVYNTRLKECDRLEACAGNLRRMGITVDTGRDWIEIHPGTPHTAEVETFRDHRIAMAFSVAALRVEGGLTLDDPGCVKKTFPDFHRAFGDFVTELNQH